MSTQLIFFLAMLLVIVGLTLWALIERSGKKKARARIEATEQAYQAERRQKEKLKDNINDILDYESKDDRIRHSMDVRIQKFKEARSEKDTKENIDDLRATLFDICIRY